VVAKAQRSPQLPLIVLPFFVPCAKSGKRNGLAALKFPAIPPMTPL